MLMCPFQAWRTIQCGSTSCSQPATTSTSPSSPIRDDSCPGLTTGGPSWTAKGGEDLRMNPQQRPGQLKIWMDELCVFTSTSSLEKIFSIFTTRGQCVTVSGSMLTLSLNVCMVGKFKTNILKKVQAALITHANVFLFVPKCGHLRPVLVFLQPSPQKASCMKVSLHCDSTSGRTTTQKHELK